MNEELKRKWIDALRSGKYTQGPNRLKHTIGPTTYYCCLGVLCEIAKQDYNLTETVNDRGVYRFGDNENGDLSALYLPGNFAHTIGLDGNKERRLSVLNDDDERKFPEIADWIEEHL